MVQSLQLVEVFLMPRTLILYGVKLENQILGLQNSLLMQYMKNSLINY